MNRGRLIGLGVAVVVLGIVASDAFFTVDETDQALVMQLGEHVRTVQEPGLKVKMPFLQSVVYYDDRVLNVDPPVEQVILADQRRLDVDTFVRYRIVDPLLFYRTVSTEQTANQRLSTIVISALRRVLGSITQLELLSEERGRVMADIRAEVAGQVERLGVQIVDVRIVRADVPEGTVQSVYDRMRSEREREAAEYRARGYEQAQQIRARADRERTVLLAEAERQAQILRGEGDAQAIAVQAEAFGRDPEFFRFYRSLQAYRQALASDDTTLVLSPDSEFFRFFNAPEGGGVLPAAPGGAPAVGAAAGGTVPESPIAGIEPPQILSPEPSDATPAPTVPASGG